MLAHPLRHTNDFEAVFRPLDLDSEPLLQQSCEFRPDERPTYELVRIQCVAVDAARGAVATNTCICDDVVNVLVGVVRPALVVIEGARDEPRGLPDVAALPPPGQLDRLLDVIDRDRRRIS